jgi:hypothetical protein
MEQRRQGGCAGEAGSRSEAAGVLSSDAGCESEAEVGPILAGLWASFSRWAGFFRLGLFREILFEMFIDLGRNWERKLSIPREIRGIGARKFVAM